MLVKKLQVPVARGCGGETSKYDNISYIAATNYPPPKKKKKKKIIMILKNIAYKTNCKAREDVVKKKKLDLKKSRKEELDVQRRRRRRRRRRVGVFKLNTVN